MRKQYRYNTKKYALRCLLVALLFASCQSAVSHTKNEEKKKAVSNNPDSSQASLQGQIDTLSKTDSDSAITNGARAYIHELYFAFLKDKAIGGKKDLADDIIVNHPHGRELYDTLMKVYKLGLQHSTKNSDIAIFKQKMSLYRQEWLKKNFAGKTNSEARKYLLHLQKDIMVVIGMVNGADGGEMRKMIDSLFKGV